MDHHTYKVLFFILKVIRQKGILFFWLFVRFVSALFPLFAIYQFSQIIKLYESRSSFENIIFAIAVLAAIRIIDNFLRLKSVTVLDQLISDISFDIHDFFLSDLKTSDKTERHLIVQAIRNFADASSNTLTLLKQPGIDSLVSLIFVPIALFFIDGRIFIMELAFILVYYFTDFYTTQRYSRLKDIQNTKTETYYAKLQDSSDFDLERKAYNLHFHRLCRWAFTEWFSLQNIAVFFYCLILFYVAFNVHSGHLAISDLILVIGYVSQTQIFLNSFSQIKDSFTDMFVALEHLAKNQSVSVIDLDDLI